MTFTPEEVKMILNAHRELVKLLLMIIEYYEGGLSDG